MTPSVAALARHVSKRARRGLFAGKRVVFGNKISEDGGNKSRRKWRPNAQRKSLYSEILEKSFKFQVTTTALRSIDKAGGLDRYILGTPPHKLDSDIGEKLRGKMMLQIMKDRGVDIEQEIRKLSNVDNVVASSRDRSSSGGAEQIRSDETEDRTMIGKQQGKPPIKQAKQQPGVVQPWWKVW